MAAVADPDPPFAGLNTAELDTCEALLARLAPDLGFDAAAVFASLRQGAGMLVALDLPPEVVELLYAQALAQFNAGDTASALLLFQALTVLAPTERDHWLGQGISLRGLKQLDAARLSFDTAVALAPQTAAPRFHLCETLCLAEDWQAATEQSKAFDLLPDSAEKRLLAAEMKRLKTVLELRSG